MQTRHRVDTSTWFDATARLPATRLIEATDADHVAAANPPMRQVSYEPYLATAELQAAVNLAIGLGRPLLLQGDPGVGKTRLAYAVAYALGLPIEQAYIKSTSKGRDLLYTYDAIRRLHDAQLGGRRRGAVDDPRQYVRLGPLGRAIARAGHGRRSVLLIDEIDKADLDFPNDLLRELDELAFEIDELPHARYAVPADRPDLRPIIIVTNNEEKALPGAFLRRCIFHYVEFPSSAEQLDMILQLHGIGEAELRREVIDVLVRLREVDLARRPGLSELLDWAGFLQAVGVPAGEIGGLPYLGALLKQRGDQGRAVERLSHP
ncbi:MoxR family ATPase [Micromonospora yasonensis]|uniref:AAA family ATPase n=1 Tax=Micromonospora yasonensis TaxID=1128667 RepID=UPI00222EC3FC|nr:MoxR family ATPase [Micromonospora yasonensis]MCW3842882.1 MoxR family ATPase [Micromonospora yasonensis]